MNEKIKELYEESRVKYSHGYDMEKFAELIVKECADIAEKWYSDYPSDDRLLSDAVKQHFGVEE